MDERLIEIETGEGKMETFICHPSQGGPFPVVILYQDFWGVREELYDIARSVAVVGYYVMVPDFFYRAERIRTDLRDADNRMKSSWLLAPDELARAAIPLQQTSDEMVVRDTGRILDFLDGEPAAKSGGKGCFGYCFGGRLILKVAAAYPDHFIAAASMHGTNMIGDEPDSAHLGIPKLKGELYFGFAEHDHWATPAMIAGLEAELDRYGIRYSLCFHDGAQHGYALPNRDIFHKAAYNRDWEHIFAMFHRQIPPSFAA